MNRLAIFLVSCLFGSNAYGQIHVDQTTMAQHMVYSSELEGKDIYWFAYMDSGQRIAASLTTLYLLNGSNLHIDSLTLSDHLQRDPIQFFEIYQSSVLVSTMKSSFRIAVTNDGFLIENKLEYKQSEKNKKGVDKVILLPVQAIGYARGWSKTSDKTTYFLLGDQQIALNEPCTISPGRSTRDTPFGISHPIGKNTLIINRVSCGDALIFDINTFENSHRYHLPLPESEFQYLMQDRTDGVFYSVYTKEGIYYILKLDQKYLPIEVVATSVSQPTSVYSGMIQFYFIYQGVYSQAFVPLDRDRSLPMTDWNIPD
jgi:hypothetical protein